MLIANDIRAEAEKLARAKGIDLVETKFTLRAKPYLSESVKEWSLLTMQDKLAVSTVSMRIEDEDLNVSIDEFSQRWLEPAVCQIQMELEDARKARPRRCKARDAQI